MQLELQPALVSWLNFFHTQEAHTGNHLGRPQEKFYFCAVFEGCAGIPQQSEVSIYALGGLVRARVG